MTSSRQPLLHDALAVLRAPTQVWSAPSGFLGQSPIHGVYYSDVRVVRGLTLTINGEEPEHIGTGSLGADRARAHFLLRGLDDATPDPGVRLRLDRTVDSAGMGDEMRLVNRRGVPVTADMAFVFDLDATLMETVKVGQAERAPIDPVVGEGTVTWSGESVDITLEASDFSIDTDGSRVVLTTTIAVPAQESASVRWRLNAHDRIAAVRGTVGAVPWAVPHITTGDARLSRWISQSLTDLDALRMATAAQPDLQFLAAGAPWFFTLFGRDSLWAARFLLPLGTRLAGDTLRVLAGLQGTTMVDDTAEEPGKIMHELRRQTQILDDATSLPPLYYGTVDATALWVCLLHDAWRWGMADDEVRLLLPTMHKALAWMRDHADADGDGLLEYVDRSGHGLANQGWKDSGDSVQWRDGTLAQGPIALCEVQAYAYEAAIHGADLMAHFGVSGDAQSADDAWGAEQWRAWAGDLRARFHEHFWVTDPELTGELGPYPAIALDAHKRRVDTVTSNMGHLLGTGLLDAEQSALVARRLGSEAMSSGYGLRTISRDSGGYWPLSYHGGAVWTHDTAIAILGLRRDGHDDVATTLIRGLLAAAEGFDYRMPELHSGDDAADVPAPVPYPAACRPQAWSAAAAVAVLQASLGLEPTADGVSTAPLAALGTISVDGVRRGDRIIGISTD